jgi:hypothetical protein
MYAVLKLSSQIPLLGGVGTLTISNEQLIEQRANPEGIPLGEPRNPFGEQRKF